MKCPNCNQVILDNKIFCTNCGKKLKKDKSGGIDPKKSFMILVIVMLLLGAGTIYMVANFGTEQELNNIINESKDSIEDFYDSYLVKEVFFTDKSSKEFEHLKDDLVGFEMELTKDKFKIGLFQILWAKIEKPKISKIVDTTIYKEDLVLDEENSYAIRIEGNNAEKDGGELLKFDMINIGSRLFLFYENTYYELEVSKLGLKSTKTYYKVDLLKETYSSKINTEIKKLNDQTKLNVESGSLEIYIQTYEEFVDNDVIHIVIRDNSGYINSGMVSGVRTISFNRNSGDKYNLKTYVEYIGKDYNDIISKYNQSRETVYELSIDGVPTKFEPSPDLLFYVKDKKLYIACGQDQWGTLFAEIEL